MMMLMHGWGTGSEPCCEYGLLCLFSCQLRHEICRRSAYYAFSTLALMGGMGRRNGFVAFCHRLLSADVPPCAVPRCPHSPPAGSPSHRSEYGREAGGHAGVRNVNAVFLRGSAGAH